MASLEDEAWARHRDGYFETPQGLMRELKSLRAQVSELRELNYAAESAVQSQLKVHGELERAEDRVDALEAAVRAVMECPSDMVKDKLYALIDDVEGEGGG